MLLPLALLRAALAQETPDLNAQLYRPPVDALRTLWTDDAATAPDGYLLGRTFLHYAKDPLIYEFDDGTQVDVLSGVMQMDLMGAAFYKNVRFGLYLPTFLAATGQDASGGGLGDVGLDLKGTVLNPDYAPLGLAIGGHLSFPTATVDLPLGSPGVGWELSLIGSQQVGPALLAANLGTRGLPETDLENVNWNDQLIYRLGAGVEVTEGAGFSLDIAGQANYAEFGGNPAAAPAEFLVGTWVNLPAELVGRLGVGTGLNQGVGSPDVRTVLAFGYEPDRIFDRDRDGIVDKTDDCPDDPEDVDQFKDADGCPDPSGKVAFRVVDPQGNAVEEALTTVRPGEPAAMKGPHQDDDSFELVLHPGEYQVEVVADRYETLATTVSVPQQQRHEVTLTVIPTFGTLNLRVRGSDGAALSGRANVGRDRLQFSNGSGGGRVDAGPGKLNVSAEGYKSQTVDIVVVAGEALPVSVTLEPARAVLTREKIEIREKVFFDTNKATIKPESFPLLDEVAQILRENPQVKKIRIEGHTDSRGSANTNRKLSDNRARSVRQYLIDKGVDASRLEAIGYGEDRPVDAANNETAWEKNRRVEFFIVEQETVQEVVPAP